MSSLLKSHLLHCFSNLDTCIYDSFNWKKLISCQILHEIDRQQPILISLAEISENSIEAMIKQYRYLTTNISRQNSFNENTFDSLKALYILSSSEI